MSAGLNLLKMLQQGGGPGGPGGALPGGLPGGPPGGPSMPPPSPGQGPDGSDQPPTGGYGPCGQCRFFQSGASAGGSMGLCTMISGTADTPPDQTMMHPHGQFYCSPDWGCAYFEPAQGGPDQGPGGPGGPAGGLPPTGP